MSILTATHIFHHVPKTGGKWLQEVLGDVIVAPKNKARFDGFPCIFAVAGSLGGRHLPYTEADGRWRIAVWREKESWFESLWRWREEWRDPERGHVNWSWGMHGTDVCEGAYEEFRACMDRVFGEDFYERLLSEYEPYTDEWWRLEELNEKLTGLGYSPRREYGGTIADG